MDAPTLRQGAATTGEQATIEGVPATEPGPDCRHYWVIEIAVSPLSRGVCRFCGTHREFSNYFGDCLAGTGKKEGYYEWLSGDEFQELLTLSDRPASKISQREVRLRT